MRRAKRASLAAGAAIGATVIFAPSAGAATFEVDSLEDLSSGNCDAPLCLREAIEDSNSNGDDDTITFASGLSGTITLTDGDLEIYGDAVDILDDGTNEITISGNDDSRIFSVYSEAPVSITGLTLTDGNADSGSKYGGGFPDGFGGGIFVNYGSDVTVADSEVTDSYASFSGGGIFSQGGTLTVTNSEISGNRSDFGGGINSSGAKYDVMTLRGGGETDRRAPGESVLTVTDSEVSGNDASFGGGILSSGDKYDDERNTRRAPGDASATITGSLVSENTAYFGAGILSAGEKYDEEDATPPSLTTLTVTDSDISGNTGGDGDSEAPEGAGGGVMAKYSDAEVAGSTIEGNETSTIGGLGVFGGETLVTDSVISGNTANDGAGGGMALGKYAALEMTDSTISGNSAGDGGGIAIAEYARYGGAEPDRSVEISRTTIAGNSADLAGGGIAFNGAIQGEIELSNSTVSGNTAAFGGGVSVDRPYNDEPPPPPDLGSDAQDPETREVAEGGSLVFSNSTIADNDAAEQGGGIYLGYYYQYDPDTEDDVAASSILPLSSTIVGDNTAAGSPNDLAQSEAPEDENDGGFTLTNSLVETPGDATVTQAPPGSSILGADPALGGLADNGGPTQTHLPAETSPAIDTGLANGLGTDQRGEQRTVDQAAANGAGDGTDIGSVELDEPPPPPPPPPPSNTRQLNRNEVPNRCAEGLFDRATLALAGDDTSQTIEGSEGDDILRGFGGNDTVLGKGGDDCLTGDDDNDIIRGNAGDDFGDGGDDEDAMRGNAGDDEMRGAGGDDQIKLAGGDDKGVGGGGDDRIDGSGGEDILRGRFGDDKLSGGNKDDAVRGGGGDDRVAGGNGDDNLRGGGGDDTMVVGKGKDVVNCGKGDDKVLGAGPNDDIAKNCETVK